MSALVKVLGNLGYGTRREVTWLFDQRRVTNAEGQPVTPSAPYEHEALRIDGLPLDAPAGSVIALNKPVGYVCSTTDGSNPTVYSLLPTRFRARSPIVAPVGRLDLDTSGLLLLTDDGALNHRLTSPKSHLPKVYVATLANPLHGDEAAQFASGTMHLAGDPDPLAPAVLEVVGPQEVRVTLHEGRYHQVRRMFAAVGNHVNHLQRIAIGGLSLGDLPAGTWRLLSADECDRLRDNARAKPAPR